MDAQAARRMRVLQEHLALATVNSGMLEGVEASPCLKYESPERLAGDGLPLFNPKDMRQLLDGESAKVLDEMFTIFAANHIFWTKDSPQAGQLYTGLDYNSTKEEQRNITFDRLMFLRDRGVFRNWLTTKNVEEMRKYAVQHEAIGYYDHSMGVKLGVHVHLWGGAVRFLGTERHHQKWLQPTEEYQVAGCFALTELGHGSNVRGIETVATYDARSQEFIISTPCESAQKFWIGGAAQHATHTVAFAQLHIGGRNEGVHAFIVPLRDSRLRVLPGIRIADCGHKIGLNGVDNGRIWFDNVRIPRENLLNAMADVTPEGRYESPISDPDQRFAAFMAPLTGGRVTIAIGCINQAKIGLSIALRYALSRRAFSLSPGQEEVLLLDYPSHQRRLLPLLAKTYALNFACNGMREMYLHRQPSDAKVIHVQSSGYKAACSWHMLRLLQECREACGGMGIRSDNRIGQLKAEHDVTATFEGDNNVLMQQVSKALLGDFIAAHKKGRPLKGMGLEHMNGPRPNLVEGGDLTSAVLRSSDFQLTLFQLRERDLLERFAGEMAERVGSGRDQANAFNESYQVATDLGTAHAEREVLEAILAATRQAANPGLKEVLGLLSSLYALVTVDEDAVFLRNSYLSASQAQAIHKEVALLCSALRPHTLTLVESFGIPPHLLGPIAFDWVDFFAWRHVAAPQEAEVAVHL
eukprot:TRINITY_DN23463_c0_g1_i1.p1 TRINITY_DN23463_c0_g1~~TRINITY_DN23463_c0_g1_i1.p1  ORF type:complete len:695 (-),score=132.58 TRINITY_DN23463_c0_g1_i1:105-2189(-)